MDDNDLNSIRADLRDTNKDYDCYALPFIMGRFSKKDLCRILNFFPFFSKEIQIQVLNQLFTITFLEDADEDFAVRRLTLNLEVIDYLINDNYFDSIDVSQHIINFFYRIFDLGPHFSSCQQRFIDIFSKYIQIHNELKTPEFYDFISKFIEYFCSTLNLLPLFISLISFRPYPSKDLVDSMVNFIYSNFDDRQDISLIFDFFEFCVKNQLDIDYEPFFQKIPFLLSKNDKKVYSSFIDFLLIFPEAKPDILPLLLQIESSIDSDKLKNKIFHIFVNKKYYEIWKESNANEIIGCVSKYLKSENKRLQSIAIYLFINYQQISNVPFSNDVAKLLIDNFEIPFLTTPVSLLLIKWINDTSMNDKTKLDLYKLILNEYDNIKIVITSNIKEDQYQTCLYSLLGTYIDIIYSFGLEEKSLKDSNYE